MDQDIKWVMIGAVVIIAVILGGSVYSQAHKENAVVACVEAGGKPLECQAALGI